MPAQQQQIKTVSKRSSKRKWVWLLLPVFVILIALHYFVFDFFIPKTATFAIPQKWRRVPLRQPMSIVRGYLGEPLPEHHPANTDEWIAGAKDRAFILKIYYVQDTIASAYSIHYRYHKWYSSRNYQVDTGTIR